MRAPQTIGECQSLIKTCEEQIALLQREQAEADAKAKADAKADADKAPVWATQRQENIERWNNLFQQLKGKPCCVSRNHNMEIDPADITPPWYGGEVDQDAYAEGEIGWPESECADGTLIECQITPVDYETLCQEYPCASLDVLRHVNVGVVCKVRLSDGSIWQMTETTGPHFFSPWPEGYPERTGYGLLLGWQIPTDHGPGTPESVDFDTVWCVDDPEMPPEWDTLEMKGTG